MKIIKQTIFLPVNVKDELPEIGKSVFTFNTMIKGRVKYPPKDNGENISINSIVEEIPNNCEKWYDEYGFGMLYSKVNTWLKQQELFVFTPEELNEYITNIIKDTLETASANAKIKTQHIEDVYDLNFKDTALENEEIFIETDGDGMPYAANKVTIDKQSITNTFEETFNKYKHE